MSCINVIENLKNFKIIYLLDKKKFKIFNYIVHIENKNFKNYKKDTQYAHISIGHIKDNKVRKKIFNKLKKNKFKLPKLISKFSTVSKRCFVDEGSILMDGVKINAGVRIGKNCIINTNVIIEHGSKIGDNCHIAPGVIINGDVEIQDNTFIGSGSIIREKTKIKKNSFIKMGSIVIKNK